MGMVALSQRIASASSVGGCRGGVTALARQRQISRQQVYREAEWVQKRLLDTEWQEQKRSLLAQIEELQRQREELTRQLSQAVMLDEDKQAELACVGQALGVSLPAIRELLGVLLPQPRGAPSVAKLGRWTQAAGRRCAALLEVLDESSRRRVRQAMADEIYVSDPVLMVVEPESLCWTTGKRVSEVTGSAWAKEFELLPALEQVTCDAGMALQSGLKEEQRRRQTSALSEVSGQLDHFHTLRNGGQAASGLERKVRSALARAEEAEAEWAERRRQGQGEWGMRTKVQHCWAKANEAYDEWNAHTATWEQVKQALPLITPEGELNTRARAEAILAETLPKLPEKFAKSKRLLLRKNTLTHLDRVYQKLAELPVEMPEEVWQAAVRQETLHRCPEKCRGEGPQAAALRGVLLVCAVILHKAGEAGQQAVQGVRKILRETWRASSLVECINSVLRMQQARHRKMTQGLLDLKRLYWNTHVFRTGRRRKQSPYQLLGIQLAHRRWWELVKQRPEQLRKELSASQLAA